MTLECLREGSRPTRPQHGANPRNRMDTEPKPSATNCIHQHTSIYTGTCTYMCLYIQTSVYVSVCVYVYMYMHTCTCTCMYMYLYMLHMHMHMHMCTCMCMYVCMCMCMCVYIYIYVYMHVYLQIFAYIYIYTQICLMFIYIYIYISTHIRIYAHPPPQIYLGSAMWPGLCHHQSIWHLAHLAPTLICLATVVIATLISRTILVKYL